MTQPDLDVSRLLEIVAKPDTRIPIGRDAPPGIVETPEEQFFVPPALQGELDPASPPQVVLVAAAAAVGKSRLASELSRMSGNPIWDLGRFPLGAGFFSGMIADAYGTERYAEVVTAIRDGRLTLILDAADEASVGSTLRGFESAIENLASVLGGHRASRVQAVILGRQDAVLETAQLLEAAGISLEVVEVSYFSRENAERFLRERASAASGSLLPEFDQFIDGLFSRVLTALGSKTWKDAESFLGYAPVLDSIALYYRNAENPYKQLQNFAAPESRGEAWRLLADLIMQILVREQEKFSRSFGGSNPNKRALGHSAYSPQYQMQALTTDVSAQLQVPFDEATVDDASWLDTLEGKAREQLQIHPFISSLNGDHARNPLLGFGSAAFRDFSIACVLLAQDSDVRSIADFWRSPEVNPTPMLRHFLEVLSASRAEATISSLALPLLCDSNATDRGSGNRILVFERPPEGGEEFGDLLIDLGHDSSGYLKIKGEGDIEIGRLCADVMVFSATRRVSVGSLVAEVVVGPRVFIGASQVEVNTLAARVAPSDPHWGPAIIRADDFRSITRTVSGAKTSLQLRTPMIGYPWDRFHWQQTSASVEFVHVSEVVEFGLAVRAIAEWFSKGSQRIPVEIIDSLLAKRRISPQAFQALMESDWVWRDGSSYRAQFGVPATTIRAVDVGHAEYHYWLTSAILRSRNSVQGSTH